MSLDATPPPLPSTPPPALPAARRERQIPFHWIWPILAGACVGVVMRVLFAGHSGQGFSPMGMAFIYLAPPLVGAVTVYVAERSARRSVSYYFVAGFLANVFFVLGTLAILYEGLICAIVIVPFFSVIGGFGGLAMGAICRLTGKPRNTLYGFAALPLLLGSVEGWVPIPDSFRGVERSISIDAPPEVVWRYLQNTGPIRPEEVEQGWMYRIGVPTPEIGQTLHDANGEFRRIRMGKGIHFDQVVVEEVPQRYVRWRYRFQADSVPPQALDEHVQIGGRHFDMLGTSYTLTPRGKGTVLGIRMDYRVSTQFNWYAAPMADALFGNLEETILQFYRRRSEATTAQAAH